MEKAGGVSGLVALTGSGDGSGAGACGCVFTAGTDGEAMLCPSSR
ncbi:MAG: hypothetical protein ACLQLH_05460 [Terracidiphilus sp.]